MAIWRTFLRWLGGKRKHRASCRFVTGFDVGGELCEALGLSRVAVRRLWIDVPCDGEVTITAKIVGSKEQMAEVKRFLLEYRAVPAPESAEQ